MAETQPIHAHAAHQATTAEERRRAQDLAYYYRNREKISAKKKAEYQADPQKFRKKNRESYTQNRERILGYKKKHRDANREEYARRAREKRKANPIPAFAYHIRKKFGLTVQQYDEMIQSQNGVCAICCKPESWGRRLAIDHCHATGKIRGLLCAKCNTAIGKLGDTVELLQRAINYLRTGIEQG